jgi:hypothetical protein
MPAAGAQAAVTIVIKRIRRRWRRFVAFWRWLSPRAPLTDEHLRDLDKRGGL